MLRKALILFVLSLSTLLATSTVFSRDHTSASKADGPTPTGPCCWLYLPIAQAPNTQNEQNTGQVTTQEEDDALQFDRSQPLAMLAQVQSSQQKQTTWSVHPRHALPMNKATRRTVVDAALQHSYSTQVNTTDLLNFAGVGDDDYGFTTFGAPPDPNLAVGATQVVQWVNTAFAVFDKATGKLLLGPVDGNTLWSGFRGPCERNNDGDPIVQYDKMAHRWVMTQFAIFGKPILQCVAVSVTDDATGAYYRYAFSQPKMNDYPKLGIWPDGYYMSYNMFSTVTGEFAGARVCAMDRTAMLAGERAKQICFQLHNDDGGLLPADLDGSRQPPAGSPNFFVSLDADSLSALKLWKFHVDFAKRANSTLVGPISIPVAPFTPACGEGEGESESSACIPQLLTKQQVDALSDRLMYRLAYRRFADNHEALVVNHTVETASGSAAVRWYELRDPNGAPVVYQQGTYAPDDTSRWMGSIAMDKVGNIALGYSASSAKLNPSIRYTGRLATDPPGTLQAEKIIMAGLGSQTNDPIFGSGARWGDYSAMSVDPVDDCTFWYTNEYLKSYGIFNWSTRLASFKFTNCQ